MFDDPWNFQRDDWTPANSARRFEAGSPNSTGQAALHASVGLLLEHGMERVGARVLRNTEFLLAGLTQLKGVQLVSHSEPARRSGIVSFRCDSVQARELYRKLAALGTTCAVREGAVLDALHQMVTGPRYVAHVEPRGHAHQHGFEMQRHVSETFEQQRKLVRKKRHPERHAQHEHHQLCSHQLDVAGDQPAHRQTRRHAPAATTASRK